MNKDVVEILGVIENTDVNRGAPIFSDFKYEKPLFISGAFSLFLTVILFLLDLQVPGVFLGVIFLFILLTYSLAQALSVYIFIRLPLKGYAVRAERRFQLRSEFVERLTRFHPESLLAVEKFVERDAKRIKGTLQTLLGAFDKAGFIPAGLALYYASTKIDSGDSAFLANLLASFVLGLYGGAFLVNRVAESLLFNLECLEEAREISEQNYSEKGADTVDTSK